MLYKVTPMMAPESGKGKKAQEPGAPRKRRKTAVYDADGNEVLITLMCLKCRSIKPLAQFGLRKMADGAIRNQPWCRSCRGGAGAQKEKGARLEEVPEAAAAQAPQIAGMAAAPGSEEAEPSGGSCETQPEL